jgi:hypothetical protein
MPFSGVLLRLLSLALGVRAARRAQDRLLPSAGEKVGGFVVISLADVPVLPPLPEEMAFRSFCRTLSPAQIYMSILVMYAGRGDFGDGFDVLEWYEKLSDANHCPEWAVSQMLSKDPLPEYLARGVRLLDEMRVHIDGLC